MNRDEIKTILPHRDSMLLLDQLDREGEIAHGQYRVKGTSGSSRDISPTPRWCLG